MTVPRLSDTERDAALARLTGWSLRDDGLAIVRVFRFADFGEAFGFMARVALAAEKADHHPEWSNVWIAGGGSGHGFKMGPAVGEIRGVPINHGAAAAPDWEGTRRR